jgi:hypothetical protein
VYLELQGALWNIPASVYYSYVFEISLRCGKAASATKSILSLSIASYHTSERERRILCV